MIPMLWESQVGKLKPLGFWQILYRHYIENYSLPKARETSRENNKKCLVRCELAIEN